jgi:steroid delta-isomerase-like uncharacterized protein
MNTPLKIVATTPEKMSRLIDTHLEGERTGNSALAISVYTDDVEHDVVGSPTGPLRGPRAAQEFYDHLICDIRTERMDVTRSYFGADFCTIEHEWTGSIPGSFLGVPGNGQRISFRMLHVFEFPAGRISRENAWLDGGTILAQLSALH